MSGRTFSCISGGLTSVPIISPSAENVELDNNQISSTNQANFIGLSPTSLSIDNNLLTRVEAFTFAEIPNTSKISLQNNNINYVDKDAFQGTRNLSMINLGTNQITHLDENTFQNLTKLRFLFLQNNLFRQLPNQLFQPVPTLETLHIQNNPLHSLNAFQFANLVNLTILNLSFLHLKDFGLSSQDIQQFQDQTSLQELQLSGNNLQTLFSTQVANIARPFRLYLGGNRMQCCPDLEWLKAEETAGTIQLVSEPSCHAQARLEHPLLLMSSAGTCTI